MPTFEAPAARPAVLPATLPATSSTTLPKAIEPRQSTEFASLIQQLAGEAAPRVPAPPVSSKTTLRRPQSDSVADQLAADSSTQQQTPKVSMNYTVQPMPAGIDMPVFTPRDAKATEAAPRKPVPEATAEAEPSGAVAVREEEKRALPAISEGVGRQPKSAPASAATNPQLVLVDAVLPRMPAPTPIKLVLPSSTAKAGASQTPGDDLRPSPAKPEQSADLRPAAALEVRMRAQDQTAQDRTIKEQTTAAPPASPPKPVQTAAEQIELAGPSQTAATAPQPSAEQNVHAIASMPEPAAVLPVEASAMVIPAIAVNPAQIINTNTSAGAPPQQPAGAAARFDEPLLRQPEQPAQPLRSLSLEFTPDGAQDVRVRLAERAGDVHISLHSTDPALTGRLSDGVHELVGTLASAGYDAQAWTPGPGSAKSRRAGSGPARQPAREPPRRPRGLGLGRVRRPDPTVGKKQAIKEAS